MLGIGGTAAGKLVRCVMWRLGAKIVHGWRRNIRRTLWISQASLDHLHVNGFVTKLKIPTSNNESNFLKACLFLQYVDKRIGSERIR